MLTDRNLYIFYKKKRKNHKKISKIKMPKKYFDTKVHFYKKIKIPQKKMFECSNVMSLINESYVLWTNIFYTDGGELS